MRSKEEAKNSLKTLKVRNRRLVLSFMRGTKAVSVNEISRATGLSKMTVHKIIDHYIEEGMIAFSGKGESTEEGGKKPNLFSFNADCRFIFAVRIDGTFVSTSLVNLKGEPVARPRITPLAALSFREAAAEVGGSFESQVRESGLPPENCMAAVVGCNGIVDVDKGVCLALYQLPAWGLNIPVRSVFQEFLPKQVSVHVNSWWRLLAHGETHFAQNGGRRRFFLIGNSGDYVSGGMVVNGEVCTGATGFAGEIGHMIVNPQAMERCVCGGRGCLESLVAPSRVLERARGKFERFPSSPVFASNGAEGTARFRVLCEEADRGDALARETMDEVTGYFALAVNNIMHTCDPGTVVLFGDYAAAGAYFMENLRSRIQHMNLHGIQKRVSLECSVITDEHGVVGAASHMTDAYFVGEQ